MPAKRETTQTRNMDIFPLVLIYIGPVVAVVLIFLGVLSHVIKPGGARVPIKGRHVFVTGGSMGIGLAIAKQAAAQGAKVSLLARGRHKLEEAREEIRRDTGADVSVYSVDVRDEEGVKKSLQEAGTVDVLVCNQGFGLARELVQMDMAEVRRMLDINVVGTFNLIRHALPPMQQTASSTPRSISIISSQAGQLGVYGYTHYCASKFALRGLAEALQQEVISHNIRVCLVCPPPVETPGYLDARKMFSELTIALASSTSKMDVKDVARETLDGIKSGKFFVPCNWQGFALSLAGSGGSPATSPLTSLYEVFLAGAIRLGLIFTVGKWYNIITKWKKAERQKTANSLAVCEAAHLNLNERRWP
ncbi:3-dehydrosphinganine reductase TSC10A-like [Wolffia australiana]